MSSYSSPEGRQNSGDNVFGAIPVGPEEASLFTGYLGAHDLAANSRRAVANDLRKFAGWFAQANREPFVVKRVTTRDVTDFRESLRREGGQAVSTVNRALVSVRRYFGWLVEKGHAEGNPAKSVKDFESVGQFGIAAPLHGEGDWDSHFRFAALEFLGDEQREVVPLAVTKLLDRIIPKLLDALFPPFGFFFDAGKPKFMTVKFATAGRFSAKFGAVSPSRLYPSSASSCETYSSLTWHFFVPGSVTEHE